MKEFFRNFQNKCSFIAATFYQRKLEQEEVIAADSKSHSVSSLIEQRFNWG